MAAVPAEVAGPCGLPALGSMCGTVTGGIAHVAGAVAANWLDQLATAMANGAGKVLAWTLSWWVHADTPAVDGPESVATWLQDRLLWLTMLAAIAGLLVGAARIALTGPRAAREVAEGLTRLLAVSVLAIPTIAALTIAGDRFAEWILGQVDTTALGQGLFDLGGGQINTGFGPAVLVVVAFLGLLTGLVQILLLLVRAAMLVILAGVLPTMAAASISEAGIAAYKRTISWTIAFLLYKPLAALIYAAALKGMSRPAGDSTPGVAGQQQILGVLTLMLALVALPALLRVVAPVVGHLGGGSGGVRAAGAGALASGAVPLARSFASPAGASAGGRIVGGRAAAAGAGAAAGAVAAPLLAAQIAERMASGARAATLHAAGAGGPSGAGSSGPPPERPPGPPGGQPRQSPPPPRDP